MTNQLRRTLLAGLGAGALAGAMPAFARQAQALPAIPGMPPGRMVEANGIRLAVYEAGSGPAIVLLHGFPELAYTWRHQIPALAAAGYRVIVPDLRGYGLSDMPPAIQDYDIAHLTGDVAGLLDALGEERALVMGHDWGGLLAWQTALLHDRRVAGVISLNTPHIPHWMLWLHPDLVRAALPKGRRFVARPDVDPIAQMRDVYRPDMYVLMFQDGQQADAAMNRDPRGSLRNAFRKDLFTNDAWDKLPPEVAHMAYYGKPLPARLPGNDVLTAQELDVYVRHFARTGFTPGIHWYRNMSRNWQAGRGLDQTIRVPALMLSAAHDVVLRPSMTDGMDRYVKQLDRHVLADCWHWTPEEKPAVVNRLVTAWLAERYPARKTLVGAA